MVTVKDVIGNYQYANRELCEKWHNNIPLSKLDDLPDSVYLYNSQDIDGLCEYFPVLPENEITGAIVTVIDGDYKEVYVTEYNRPYDLSSIYHPIDYYLI